MERDYLWLLARLHDSGAYDEVSVGHRVPASAHRVSVDTRLGYKTDVDDILGSSNAMDNSAEAIAAGTQWNADDAASYEPVGAAYDILAYTVDLVRAGK